MKCIRRIIFGIICALLFQGAYLISSPSYSSSLQNTNTPPSIVGESLQDEVNYIPTTVYTYQTSPEHTFTVLDPDIGQELTLSVRVEGPIGGIIGGGTGIVSDNDGKPFNRSISFIAGAATGETWIAIEVNDTHASTKKFFNFKVEANPQPLSGVFFEVGPITGEGEHWISFIINPEQIQAARDVMAGRIAPLIVVGRLVKGWGDFNLDPSDPGKRQWGWHLDPTSVALAEVTIELCDGRPSFVQEQLDYWVNQVGYYCPWSHTVLREIQTPSPTPVPLTPPQTIQVAIAGMFPLAAARTIIRRRTPLGKKHGRRASPVR